MTDDERCRINLFLSYLVVCRALPSRTLLSFHAAIVRTSWVIHEKYRPCSSISLSASFSPSSKEVRCGDDDDLSLSSVDLQFLFDFQPSSHRLQHHHLLCLCRLHSPRHQHTAQLPLSLILLLHYEPEMSLTSSHLTQHISSFASTPLHC